jgi:DNA polymerase III sliding clamp (beta) subunit (PCNA family)
VDAGDLLESLARCAQLADAKSGSVLFTFGADSEFTIDSADAAAGEAREVVTCTGAVPSEFRTRINGEFLINILKKLNGPITIQVPTDNAKPLLFKAEPHEGETLDYIVMPMRV